MPEAGAALAKLPAVPWHVNKGDELGMFHFGGATHVLLLRPGVQLDFDLHGQEPGLNSSNIPVRARIATVRSAAP